MVVFVFLRAVYIRKYYKFKNSEAAKKVYRNCHLQSYECNNIHYITNLSTNMNGKLRNLRKKRHGKNIDMYMSLKLTCIQVLQVLRPGAVLMKVS